MRFLKLLSTALVFHILVSSISYSQVWENTSGLPANDTEVLISSYLENFQEVQYALSKTGEGLRKSINTGQSWTFLSFANVILTEIVRYSAFAEMGPHIIQEEYIVTAENGIYKSTDYGETWTHITIGIEGFFITGIEVVDNNELLIGTSGHGVYKSTDGGNSWLPFNNGMEDQTVLDMTYRVLNDLTKVLFATTINGGAWQYNEANQIWEQKNQGNPIPFNPAIAINSEGNLYMYSIDNILGTNYLNPQWQIEHNHPAGKEIVITNDDKVFAASLGFGVAKKDNTDNFGSWVDYSEGLPVDNAGYIDVFDINIAPDGHLWAVVTPLDPTVTGGIYRTIDPVTDVEEISPGIPNAYILEQNYPNPFNPSTTISWQSPVSSWQTLKVYDVLGNVVAILVDEYNPAGSYKVDFDAGSLSSGIYFYTLQAEGVVETKKMILIK